MNTMVAQLGVVAICHGTTFRKIFREEIVEPHSC
jgi:hypothetical protein